MAFDCIRVGVKDFRGQPLTRRREELEEALHMASGPIVVARRLLPNGLASWEEVKRHGWEGLVAKDSGSTYQPGRRSESWIKVKHRIRQGWPEEGLERRRS